MSAADAAYFRSLLQLAASLARHVDTHASRVVVYDLGLTTRQQERLRRSFPFVTVRTFDFAAYPEVVRIQDRMRHTLSWKPQILRTLVAGGPGLVLWLDSATVVCAPLDPVVAWTTQTGLYAPFGGASTVAELTHPATLAALAADHRTQSLRMRAAGVLGFDATRPDIRELVDRWADLSLDARIIAPPGATHANHRFDMSILNILLAGRPDLLMTGDELDISSDRPSAIFRARNKVHPLVPLWLDPLARAWFRSYRAIDVAIWRLKRRRAHTGG